MIKWQPKQEYVNEECQVISTAYNGKMPDGYEPFIQDCAKISAFLKDENAVLIQLKKLNNVLNEEANRDLVVSEDAPYLKHNKVLRSVLEQELRKMGFQPELGKALGFLKGALFRSCLCEGLFIKDPGAKVIHGEFTHAIQWILIGWQQNDTQFLSQPVIDVFKQLGDPRSVLFDSGDGMETSIWDLIVDRTANDCGSPEYLHNQLILKNSDPDLALLKTLCDSRVKKRQMQKQAPLIFYEKPSNETHNKCYEPSAKDKNLLLPKKKQ